MDHIYVPDSTINDHVVPLSAEAMRHVAALRLRDGEPVKVLNGRGLVLHCRCERTQSNMRIVTETAREVEPPPGLTLALSVLDNRDRYEFALEKATELGITRFVPVLADRSQHHRVNVERLTTKAIAAITQCGVAWLPEVHRPVRLEDVPWGDVVIMGDDTGSRPTGDDVRGHVTIVVGPEGDLSEREKDLLGADPRTTRWAIGRNRLRAETAAIALVSTVVGLSASR
jgi:16S rRNA (uracil1498-N3)-methyltransferase